MPKMKTNAAAKKRFTFTGTGKIKRKHNRSYHNGCKQECYQKRDNLDNQLCKIFAYILRKCRYPKLLINFTVIIFQKKILKYIRKICPLDCHYLHLLWNLSLHDRLLCLFR